MKQSIPQLKVPAKVWIAFDPKGRARQVFLGRPAADRIGWLWVEDNEPNRSSMYSEDVAAARRAGYRIKPVRLISE